MATDEHGSDDRGLAAPPAQTRVAAAAAEQAEFQRSWQEVVAKLAELKQLDWGLRREGASVHRYQFAPPVAPAQIASVESKLGAPLPAELVYFYTTIGNGGVGPFGGIAPIEALALFKVDAEGEETEEAEEDAEAEDTRRSARLDDQCERYLGYRLVGLVSRSWEFYASGTDDVLVALDGPEAGSVIAFTEIYGDLCYFNWWSASLAAFYLDWINHELGMFAAARALVLLSDELADFWEHHEEVLNAAQKQWSAGALDFRERTCATFGWLYFATALDILDWTGCVLGVDLTPEPYTTRPDFAEPTLQARYLTARQRYLAPR